MLRSSSEEPVLSAYELKKKFFSKQDVVVMPDNRFDMRSFEGFDGATIAVISIAGPLMKADYCGSFGTASIRDLIQLAEQTTSVKTILFVIDSPGGTVDGTQLLADAITNCTKKTIALIDGYCCSAAYWIASACNEIYASANTDIIGSIGTMIGFYDDTQALQNEGLVLREFYATDSVDKNAAFRDAQNGDGKRIVAEYLDPTNSIFKTNVQNNRTGKIDLKKENVLTGKIYHADEAVKVGLIDGISSFDHIINSTLNNQSIMSTTNFPFEATLKAANAESFPVTNGGFLVTEENLKSLESALAPGAAVSAAVGAQLSALQAKEKDFNASAEKITKLEQDLNIAKAELATAQGSLQTANDNLSAANAELATLRQKPGAPFASTVNKQDPPQQETDAVDQSRFAHNRYADEFLG